MRLHWLNEIQLNLSPLGIGPRKNCLSFPFTFPALRSCFTPFLSGFVWRFYISRVVVFLRMLFPEQMLSHKSKDNAAIFSAQGRVFRHLQRSLQKGEGWEDPSTNQEYFSVPVKARGRWIMFPDSSSIQASTVEIEWSCVRSIPGPCGLQKSLRTTPNPNLAVLCIWALLTILVTGFVLFIEMCLHWNVTWEATEWCLSAPKQASFFDE